MMMTMIATSMQRDRGWCVYLQIAIVERTRTVLELALCSLANVNKNVLLSKTANEVKKYQDTVSVNCNLRNKFYCCKELVQGIF